MFFRAGTFLFLLPLLGRPVPIQIRIAMAVFLSYSAVLLIPPPEGLAMFTHWSSLLAFALVESFLGFCMALGVLLLFHLVQTAGELISSQMGLMQSNILNPMSGSQESVLGTGLMMLTLAMIFILDVHHEILYGFLQSLHIAPVGTVPMDGRNVEFVLYETGKIFLISIQMAAPIIAVNYIVTLSFAFLGKIIPTMNVLILSFSVRLMLGFLVLTLVFYMLAQLLLRFISSTPERMLQFLPF
ncbi:MAG: flagellar biosynthetic protein FliR [Opitutales bacterium]|nr:flagellar biosynthetic protein FliR [Opitutales bacterium]